MTPAAVAVAAVASVLFRETRRQTQISLSLVFTSSGKTTALSFSGTSFAHLHLHTEYSMLDGAARINEVVEAAAADAQPAVAITDHGVMYGVVDFYQAAQAVGIKPIIGIEAYVVDGSRFDRPRAAENQRMHMTLLATSQVGYHNLMKLSSLVVSRGLLLQATDGRRSPRAAIPRGSSLPPDVSAALWPVISHPTPAGRKGAVARSATSTRHSRLRPIPGHLRSDNFFIEVMDHGLEAQRLVTPDLLEIGRQIGAPLLATNDAHYTRRSEADAHDVLLCIQTASNRDDANRLKFDAQEFYLKSAAEMRALFPRTSIRMPATTPWPSPNGPR